MVTEVWNFICWSKYFQISIIYTDHADKSCFSIQVSVLVKLITISLIIYRYCFTSIFRALDNQFWTKLFSFVQFPFVQYCNSLIPFDIILLNPPIWITLHLVIRSANMDKRVSWAKFYTFHILDMFEMQIILRKSIKDVVVKSRLHWISKLNNTIFSCLLKELAADLHDW